MTTEWSATLGWRCTQAPERDPGRTVAPPWQAAPDMLQGFRSARPVASGAPVPGRRPSASTYCTHFPVASAVGSPGTRIPTECFLTGYRSAPDRPFFGRCRPPMRHSPPTEGKRGYARSLIAGGTWQPPVLGIRMPGKLALETDWFAGSGRVCGIRRPGNCSRARRRSQFRWSLAAGAHLQGQPA